MEILQQFFASMENTLSLLFLNTAASVINFYGNSHCVQQKKSRKDDRTENHRHPRVHHRRRAFETVAETTRRSLNTGERACPYAGGTMSRTCVLVVLSPRSQSEEAMVRAREREREQQEKRFPRRSWESAAVLERARAKASEGGGMLSHSLFS